MTRRLILICCALVAGSGCDSTPETPTTPTTPSVSTAITSVFSGTLTQGGTQTWAFSLPSPAQVRFTLGSLTDTTTGQPTGRSLRLTFGIPSGTGCGPLQSVTTAAGLATHLSAFGSAGTYCVSVTDIGQLGGSSDFAVRVTFGDPVTSSGSGVVTYTSTILPGGTTTRTFVASNPGTVAVVFDTLTPQSASSLVVGLGFPRADGGGCQLTRSFVATRGFQFELPVEAGTYCVGVTDAGSLAGAGQFSLRIFHP